MTQFEDNFYRIIRPDTMGNIEFILGKKPDIPDGLWVGHVGHIWRNWRPMKMRAQFKSVIQILPFKKVPQTKAEMAADTLNVIDELTKGYAEIGGSGLDASATNPLFGILINGYDEVIDLATYEAHTCYCSDSADVCLAIPYCEGKSGKTLNDLFAV